MSFIEAVRSCFSRSLTWQGRAGRAEYWWFALFGFICYIVVDIIDIAGHTFIPGILLALILILPGIAVTIRRLHDIGRSGAWYWIVLIPLAGAIVLLVFACSASQGPNQYGGGPAGPVTAGAVTA